MKKFSHDCIASGPAALMKTPANRLFCNELINIFVKTKTEKPLSKSNEFFNSPLAVPRCSSAALAPRAAHGSQAVATATPRFSSVALKSRSGPRRMQHDVLFGLCSRARCLLQPEVG